MIFEQNESNLDQCVMLTYDLFSLLFYNAFTKVPIAKKNVDFKRILRIGPKIGLPKEFIMSYVMLEHT